MASSDTGGVQPMRIEGRTDTERERLIGMTEEERKWRARFLKSQILAPEEPVVPKGWYQERFNPIRRFYRFPMDKVESALTPLLGETKAHFVRHLLAKSAIGIFAVYSTWYYLKYNKMTWERKSGWRVTRSRPMVYPGTKDFPNYEKRSKGNQYNVHEFDKSPI